MDPAGKEFGDVNHPVGSRGRAHSRSVGDGLKKMVGCVAQLAERRSLAGELTLSCAQPSANG